MLSISQPLAPMLKTGEAEAYLKHSNSSSNQQQAKFDDVGVLRRTCQRFFASQHPYAAGHAILLPCTEVGGGVGKRREAVCQARYLLGRAGMFTMSHM